MADVLVLTYLQLPVLLQQPLLVTHAQFPLFAADPHEPPVASRPQTPYLPHLLLLGSHHAALLDVEEALSEGMIDVGRYDLVPLRIVRGVRLRGIDFNEFPDIILCNVVRIVRAARYLIERSTLRYFDLMGMQIVLRLDIAKDECVV